MTAAIANLPAANVAPIPARHRPRGMNLEGMQDCLRFAEVAVASGILSPAFMKAPDPIAAAFVAIQLGAEVGLSPMASLQNIAVINGRPGLFGPAMLAVVEASGLMENFEEWIEGEGDKMVAYCKVKRFGRPERVTAFSWADAVKARLPGKQGPWTEYPKRMMQARARGFALKDVFPDVLAGLANTVEELQDIPAEPRDVTPTAVIPPKQSLPKPAPKPPIKVKVPGQPDALFPQDEGLDAALKAAMDFMSDGINEGRTDVVGANVALLDRIIARLPHKADDVAELRAAAAMQEMIDAEKPEEPDTFVERFVNGDEAEPDDFPGTVPPKP